MLHLPSFTGIFTTFHSVQVSKVKDQAVSREEALQTKILELEAEKSRRDGELRLLHHSKLTVSITFIRYLMHMLGVYAQIRLLFVGFSLCRQRNSLRCGWRTCSSAWTNQRAANEAFRTILISLKVLTRPCSMKVCRHQLLDQHIFWSDESLN